MAERPPVRPFLKWAGGKTQLLRPIGERLPAAIRGAYLEPFLGSGAVFFHLRATGRLRGKALLSDANGPLIEAWLAVRDEVDALVDLLAGHRAAHARGAKDHFHAVRAEVPAAPVERAARFLYLNRTCYNGLWRVNSRGLFNVPMGRYQDPAILDEGNLRACSAALRGVEIREEGFATAMARARSGAVAYLDPPYEPLSRTSNFTSYTAARFGRPDQEALADDAAALRDRGGWFLLSNHDTRWLRDLYRARGFEVASVPARRAINSDPASRGAVRELLVTPGEARG
ncbi:MAG: Dam family site-specific DNA-(adenine-N6)-methyltransferase [Planctomycetaceae bacterium]|nr:Dam family site-specific DNA-(adenine-N6)-methyltransferase [Planctomycetota bacterium]NUN53374.1 Dam family site-specific DNA-(adenine-N6)-methyltransferase [Planctomycetaceae bacterium]